MNKLKYYQLMIIMIIVSVLSSCIDETIGKFEANSHPNIIFIIADDLGWDAYGKFPGTTGLKANTPTIDL
jgi:arylsulfatase B